MDPQTLSVSALVLAALTAWLALRKQANGGGNTRIEELEAEINVLRVRIDDLEILNKTILSAMGERERELDRMRANYQVVDAENKAYRRRMAELGLALQ